MSKTERQNMFRNLKVEATVMPLLGESLTDVLSRLMGALHERTAIDATSVTINRAGHLAILRFTVDVAGDGERDDVCSRLKAEGASVTVSGIAADDA